jgi:hypothetical protein
MPQPSRIFAGDVELGKRDDDHKPGSRLPLMAVSDLAAAWTYHRYTIRKNLRKGLIGLALVIGLYYFFKNMPTDLGPRTPRPNYRYQPASGEKNQWANPKTAIPKSPTGTVLVGQDVSEGQPKHWYTGKVKFYELAESLHTIMSINRNVLFAASNPKSAAILIPLACEMANEKKNLVHFAIMGRDNNTMEFLKEINGVKKEYCDVRFHGTCY